MGSTSGSALSGFGRSTQCSFPCRAVSSTALAADRWVREPASSRGGPRPGTRVRRPRHSASSNSLHCVVVFWRVVRNSTRTWK